VCVCVWPLDSSLRTGLAGAGTKRSYGASRLPRQRSRLGFLWSCGRMIASHMIACLFTELNRNQVQKVNQHRRGQLACFPIKLLGFRESPGSCGGSLPHSGLGTRKKIWVIGKLLELEEPRPLGSGRLGSASEARGSRTARLAPSPLSCAGSRSPPIPFILVSGGAGGRLART
jgi:hypothetical protein